MPAPVGLANKITQENIFVDKDGEFDLVDAVFKEVKGRVLSDDTVWVGYSKVMGSAIENLKHHGWTAEPVFNGEVSRFVILSKNKRRTACSVLA